MRKGVRGAGLLLVGLTIAGLSACVLGAPYDKYAIVYGVSIYDSGLAEGVYPNLKYPDDDAVAMKAMLIAQGYQVWMQTNTDADLTNLLADINSVALTAKEDDLFVFYFSGHGGFGGSGPEPAGSDPVTEWIFLYGSLSDSSQTFSDDQLLAAFGPIAARKKVIILDSCNSGGFIGNHAEADIIPPQFLGSGETLGEIISRALTLYANYGGAQGDIAPEDALVIAASGEREVSWEGLYGHGVLTYFLLAAESGGDRNHDGYVTVSEAYYYAYRRIMSEWNPIYGAALVEEGYDGLFSPHVSGGPVDYVLFEAR